MKMQYSLQTMNEHMAKAFGRDLPISYKQSIEIANYIRGDTLTRAKAKLTAAINKTEAIPFKRFTDGVGHRRGKIAAGRYPFKACTGILKLLSSAESNALFKGLNAKNLVVMHISVKKAAGAWHYGRHHRRQMKRCHIEVVLEEQKQVAPAEKKVAEKKPEAAVKTDVKAETKAPAEAQKPAAPVAKETPAAKPAPAPKKEAVSKPKADAPAEKKEAPAAEAKPAPAAPAEKPKEQEPSQK